MKPQAGEFWNARYNTEDYIYGTKPNDFFKEQLDKLKPADILLPAEGEGRNALYAAKQNWNVIAFDPSSSGRKKALKLAAEQSVEINYEVADVLEFLSDKKFDVLGLVYAHFSTEIRKVAHQRLLEMIKPGGSVIFEAFAKAQLGNDSGGPKNVDMLFSIEEIEAEFKGLKFTILEEKSIELQEGEFHKGKADVIRFVGVKN